MTTPIDLNEKSFETSMCRWQYIASIIKDRCKILIEQDKIHSKELLKLEIENKVLKEEMFELKKENKVLEEKKSHKKMKM